MAENINTTVEHVDSDTTPRIMTNVEYLELFQFLNEAVYPGCDNTLKWTTQWIQERPDLDVDLNLSILRRLGGYCDCEVLMNVDFHWRRQPFATQDDPPLD